MKYSVAVEGGGSHTRLGLYDASGILLSELTGGPGNPAAYGVAACARGLAGSVRVLLDGRSVSELRLYLALAGAAEKRIQEDMAEAMAALLAPASILITADLHAMLHANAGEGAGLLVISGTGAAILGRDSHGRLERAGGWGALLGDEGSAYGVAAAGLRAGARAIDGVGPETQLIEALPPTAGLASFTAFIQWTATATKRDIAALAPTIALAAREGDLVARACLDEEARRLAALVVAAQERLGLGDGTRLFQHGGFIEGCDLFREAFHEALAVYSDMQLRFCACRGHEAVISLASFTEPPEWATQWTSGDVASARVVLPVTEAPASEMPLDELSIPEFVEAMHRADLETVAAVKTGRDAIVQAIEHAARALRGGGRIMYVGAGTSGRLGALDAAECPPTFGVSSDRVVALMAGGDQAMRASVEGAEDDAAQGAAAMASLHPSQKDFVVGIAASGTTPYVLAALRAARDTGATVGLITSNTGVDAPVDALIALETGPELLAGSTRLKAGTAAKLVLNMISTGAMAQAGYVYKGRMIGMTPVNDKLRARAARIVAELADVDVDKAIEMLDAAGYHIATAIVMILRKKSRTDAEALLRQHDGRLRDALHSN